MSSPASGSAGQNWVSMLAPLFTGWVTVGRLLTHAVGFSIWKALSSVLGHGGPANGMSLPPRQGLEQGQVLASCKQLKSVLTTKHSISLAPASLEYLGEGERR